MIGGAIIATGTGAGLATSISLFIFGVPWATGALMLLPASRKLRSADEMSLSIALAYKLLDRIEEQAA